MTIDSPTATAPLHQHVFLGEGHEQSERKTWAVIWLCGAMMCAEIVGGLLFGSIVLMADGLHMSTHAGALLLAALAYTYARRHAAVPIPWNIGAHCGAVGAPTMREQHRASPLTP
jgi:Co/Zn/Cd efflux system component